MDYKLILDLCIRKCCYLYWQHKFYNKKMCRTQICDLSFCLPYGIVLCCV
jgi:hypothetical protein